MSVVLCIAVFLCTTTQLSTAALVMSENTKLACMEGGIKATCFRCLNCNLVIPRDEICDGKFDCRDLSDELLCPEKRIRYDSRLQNALARLQVGIDLLKEDSAVELVHRMCIPECVVQKLACTHCQPGEFQCSPVVVAGKPCGCVVKTKICDGVFDCPNGEDENYCGTELMKRYNLKVAKRNISATNQMELTGQHLNTLARSRIRCEMIECISKFPRPCAPPPHRRNNVAILGRNRESWERIAPQTRSGLIDIFPDVSVADTPRIMDINASAVFSYLRENRNPNSPLSLEQYRLHDNISLLYGPDDHVPDGIDLVQLDKVCDGTPDCPGLEDELSCPGKFYCENRNPLYIDKLRKMDGVADCSDSSDEWEQKNVHHSLSSRYNLIDNWTLQVLVWVMAIVALLGNMVVAWNTVIELVKTNRVATANAIMQKQNHTANDPTGSRVIRTISGIKFGSMTGSSRKFRVGGGIAGQRRLVKTWNSVLVLNLATSDLIMGIYLLWLGVMSFLYEGKTSINPYWSIDREWRTGATCNVLGTLLVVSSQTSVFILVALTSLRLYTVLKPFASYHLKFRYLFAICCLTWLFATFIAVAPIMPGLEDIFISQAWVPFPQFKPPVINRTDGDTLMRGIAYILNEDLVEGQPDPPAGEMTWSMMVNFLKRVAPHHSDWQFFGYYSEDSVCMPKLYVTRKDRFWGHAASILILNFISVIYIAVSYFVIYYKSKQGHNVPRNQNIFVDTDNKSKSHAESGEFKKTEKPLASWSRKPSVFTRSSKATRRSNFSTSSVRLSKAKRTRSLNNSTAEMQRRIALLVATDCACWIPICIMGFISLAGHRIPDTAYAITAIGLMPINSALNPLLYSRIMRSLWSRGWSSFRSRLSSKSSSNVSFEASSCEVNKHAAAKKVSSASFYGSAIVEEDKTSDASVSSDVGTDEVIDCSVVTTTIPATRHLATPKDAPIDEESDIDYGIDSYYEEDSDDVTDNPPCNDIHQTELPTFH